MAECTGATVCAGAAVEGGAVTARADDGGTALGEGDRVGEEGEGEGLGDNELKTGEEAGAEMLGVTAGASAAQAEAMISSARAIP